MGGSKSYSRRQITLADCVCTLKPNCEAMKTAIERAGMTFRNCPVG